MLVIKPVCVYCLQDAKDPVTVALPKSGKQVMCKKCAQRLMLDFEEIK